MEQVNVCVCIIADSVPDLTVKLSFLFDCELTLLSFHLVVSSSSNVIFMSIMLCQWQAGATLLFFLFPEK